MSGSHGFERSLGDDDAVREVEGGSAGSTIPRSAVILRAQRQEPEGAVIVGKELSDALLLALTFACGFAYECGCVFWVHHSERGEVRKAVAWSCFNALVTVIGLGEALHRPAFIAAYVVGFGAGTAAGMRIKRGPDRDWKELEDEAARIWRGRQR